MNDIRSHPWVVILHGGHIADKRHIFWLYNQHFGIFNLTKCSARHRLITLQHVTGHPHHRIIPRIYTFDIFHQLSGLSFAEHNDCFTTKHFVVNSRNSRYHPCLSACGSKLYRSTIVGEQTKNSFKLLRAKRPKILFVNGETVFGISDNMLKPQPCRFIERTKH